MLETILVVLGMLLAGSQHTVDGEAEYQFYNGVGMGCAGSAIVVLGQRGIELSPEDAIVFCAAMVQAAQERDLYGGQVNAD
jgi:hypothetical protein